jgi:FkbM family methyltransferase
VKRLVWIALPVLAMLSLLYHPVRMTAFVAAGLNQTCPLERALESDRDAKQQVAFKDEIFSASRLMETDAAAGLELYETPFGRYWIPKENRPVLAWNLAEIKRGIYFSGDHTVRPGDVVIDAGANVGAFTRMALNQGAARVIAIEPGPENVAAFHRNFEAEIASGRVVLVPKGVWDQVGEMDLRVSPSNSAADSFVMNPPDSKVIGKVPLTTIDNLVSELYLEKVDFIKMDIEGAEPNAIDGAKRTLARFKPRISVAAYHAGDHPKTIPARIQAARSDYTKTCGPCAEVGFGVRPDILYFH